MVCTISVDQALDVWADLEDAYRDEHGYGGDIAEIYAYRLMPYSPRAHVGSDDVAQRQLARDAGLALVAICKMFEQRRECRIEIETNRDEWDGLDQWLSKGGLMVHREHVRVTRKRPD